VFVLYEEIVNQYPRKAFYSGVFTNGEISVRAMNHEAVSSFFGRKLENNTLFPNSPVFCFGH
jgi:hypothetical protein